MKNPPITLFQLTASWLLLSVCLANAQTTAFTYQGRLNDGANAANGSYDLTFALFNVESGEGQIGNTITNLNTAVSNGLFTATVDFGDEFPGAERWLEIGVRTNGGGAFSALSPRQSITATPYAVRAANLSGTLAAGALSGTYDNAVSFSNPGNSFTGNGAGLSNLSAAALSGNVPSAALVNAWKISGNSGTIPGTHFIGTTDNQPVELRVNGSRRLLLDTAGNLVGGDPTNKVAVGQMSVIAGGGDLSAPNTVSGSYSAILGGFGNSVNDHWSVVGGGANNEVGGANSVVVGGSQNTNLSHGTFLGGGVQNTIATGANNSTLSGGNGNTISNNALSSVIGGGAGNLVSASYGFIGGGTQNRSEAQQAGIASGVNNQIGPTGNLSFIGGGLLNQISGSGVIAGGSFNLLSGGGSAIVGGSHNTNASSEGFIGGGSANMIQGNRAVIGGGFSNQVTGSYSTIAGGLQNLNTGDTAIISGGQQNTNSGSSGTLGGGFRNRVSGQYAIVPGGSFNVAQGNNSMAAGLEAKALHDGSFVWASGSFVDFSSTSNNQFLIRADGGVGIGTNNPQAALHVVGTIKADALAIGTFSGNGSGLTNIAFTNLGGVLGSTQLSGTYANPVTLNNVANNFVGAFTGAHAGNGSGLTNLNVSNLTGTVADAQLSTNIGRLNSSQTFSGANTFNNVANSFTGDGSGLTSLNSSNLTGNVDARLSSNVPLLNASQTFTGTNRFNSSVGIGIAPQSTLHVNGTARVQGVDNWDVNNTEGDFRVGNDTQRFKIGVATGGGGAGDVWMRAQGGTARVFIKTPGGTTFYSNEGQTAGVSLAANGASWAVISDRNVKKDFAAVDSVQVLEKLAAMPITQWHYNWESAETTPHIGPMAQDFKAAFYPGTDDKSITTQEADGVALAAIQGLNQKLEDELKHRNAENAELKQRLEKLEQLMNAKTRDSAGNK